MDSSGEDSYNLMKISKISITYLKHHKAKTIS
jgi:hypothetical protein